MNLNEYFKPRPVLRNFDKSSPFNLCVSDAKGINTNVNLGDYLSYQQMSLPLTIMVYLSGIYASLRQFESVGMFDCIAKYLMRSIGWLEFYRGPKLGEQENQNQVQETQENIELEVINEVSPITSASNSSADCTESQETSHFIKEMKVQIKSQN